VAPYVIDHFRNGVQTSRTNYESVEFNKTVPDSLFAKPASIKAVK
jgi:outer membrane lipoprotein-sorting protein